MRPRPAWRAGSGARRSLGGPQGERVRRAGLQVAMRNPRTRTRRDLDSRLPLEKEERKCDEEPPTAPFCSPPRILTPDATAPCTLRRTAPDTGDTRPAATPWCAPAWLRSHPGTHTRQDTATRRPSRCPARARLRTRRARRQVGKGGRGTSTRARRRAESTSARCILCVGRPR